MIKGYIELRDKAIMIISPEPWDHIFVSKHHYAIQLAERRNRVYFLDPPSDTFGVRKTEFSNLSLINSKPFLRGLRFLPRFLIRVILKRRIRLIESLISDKIEVVWSFDNSVFFDFASFDDHVLKICHIVDLSQAFQFETAASSADLCIGVTDVIVEKLRKYNNSSFFIQHGVSERPIGKPIELSGAFKGPSSFHRRVGYAGNLSLKYIDWGVLRSLIEIHENVFFCFAGPYDVESAIVQWLLQKRNVLLTGRIESSQLRSFYQQMDILLLCYKIHEYPLQLTNSHKMMEYLASGTVVCASWTDHYEELVRHELVLMARDGDEFLRLFNRTLLDCDIWNSEERRNGRIQFALDNTYERQIQRIEALINT